MASELPHYIENFQGELLRMRQEVARAGNRIHSLIAELELVCHDQVCYNCELLCPEYSF